MPLYSISNSVERGVYQDFAVHAGIVVLIPVANLKEFIFDGDRVRHCHITTNSPVNSLQVMPSICVFCTWGSWKVTRDSVTVLSNARRPSTPTHKRGSFQGCHAMAFTKRDRLENNWFSKKFRKMTGNFVE